MDATATQQFKPSDFVPETFSAISATISFQAESVERWIAHERKQSFWLMLMPAVGFFFFCVLMFGRLEEVNNFRWQVLMVGAALLLSAANACYVYLRHSINSLIVPQRAYQLFSHNNYTNLETEMQADMCNSFFDAQAHNKPIWRKIHLLQIVQMGFILFIALFVCIMMAI